MRIGILFCVILWLAYIEHSDTAVQAIKKESKIEERMIGVRRSNSYMSNQKIRNKFTTQWNLFKKLEARMVAIKDYDDELTLIATRLDGIETDIDDIQSNEDDIEDSFGNKCDQLDSLLDPEFDCCISGLQVICISRFQSTFLGFSLTKGDCATCPDGVAQ